MIGDGVRTPDEEDDANGEGSEAPLNAGALDTPEKGRLSPTDGATAFGGGVCVVGGRADAAAAAADEDGGALKGEATGACLGAKVGGLNATGTADAGMVFKVL